MPPRTMPRNDEEKERYPHGFYEYQAISISKRTGEEKIKVIRIAARPKKIRVKLQDIHDKIKEMKLDTEQRERLLEFLDSLDAPGEA